MLLTDALENAPLTPEQKVYFEKRYMDLVSRYRKKYRKINVLYNTLRLTVMTGSIFIPALLTLQKDPTTIISLTTYWVVFALSLCVTLSNSMLELFNVAAVNTKYWLHVQRLETEGWQFLHLTESYSKYPSVTAAFSKFTSRVEKLHLSLVFDLLRLENRNKSVTSKEDKVSGGGYTTSVGGSIGGSIGPPLSALESTSLQNNQRSSNNFQDNDSSLQDHQPDFVMSLQEFQSKLGEAPEKKI